MKALEFLSRVFFDGYYEDKTAQEIVDAVKQCVLELQENSSELLKHKVDLSDQLIEGESKFGIDLVKMLAWQSRLNIVYSDLDNHLRKSNRIWHSKFEGIVDDIANSGDRDLQVGWKNIIVDMHAYVSAIYSSTSNVNNLVGRIAEQMASNSVDATKP